LEFRDVDFYGKTLVAMERTNKQLNSYAVPEPRIEPTTYYTATPLMPLMPPINTPC
jgi:hypothetical protein